MFDRSVATRFDSFRHIPEPVITQVQSRIITAAALQPGSVILEVGAGTGRFGRGFLAQGLHYTGLDSSRDMLDQGQRLQNPLTGKSNLVQGTASHLPFATGCFDLVLLVQVLGVVPGWRRALAECRRVLTPGGHAVVGRVEHDPNSLQAVVRAERIRLLSEQGIDAGRPGAQEHEILAAIAGSIGPATALTPVPWEAEQTPRAAVEANLSGWRVQALPPDERDRLRDQLLSAVSQHYGNLDTPITETRRFALSIATETR